MTCKAGKNTAPFMGLSPIGSKTTIYHRAQALKIIHALLSSIKARKSGTEIGMSVLISTSKESREAATIAGILYILDCKFIAEILCCLQCLLGRKRLFSIC